MTAAASTAAGSGPDRLEGHGPCGAVRVRVGAHPGRVGACPCRMCRRWSGGVFLSFVACAVEFEGPVMRYPSSDFAERAFCAVCGSNLWMHDIASDTWELMPGLFDAARDWPLASEVYADCAMAAVQTLAPMRRATRAEYESRNLHVAGETP